MLRRNFMKASVASIFGVSLTKGSTKSKKSGDYCSLRPFSNFQMPTHKIKAKSTKGYRIVGFTCSCDPCYELKIGGTVRIKWQDEKELEEFTITDIEDIREDNVELLNA